MSGSEGMVVDQARAPKSKGRESQAALPELTSPSLYINRELSLLEYYRRVIAQASEDRHPLLERVSFLSMSGNMMDEFFMVRVSDLQDELEEGLATVAPDAMTPAQLLAAVRKRVIAIYREQQR